MPISPQPRKFIDPKKDPIDYNKKTICLNSLGQIELCCCVSPCPPEEFELWCCAGLTSRSCTTIAKGQIVRTEAGSPVYDDFNWIGSKDDCFSEIDQSSAEYPGTSIKETNTTWNISATNAEKTGSGNKYTVRIELVTNPEGHPGWEFELTFSGSNPAAQSVEITLPESPIADLVGSKTFVFANTEPKALQDCAYLCCPVSDDFEAWTLYPQVALKSNGYWAYPDLIFGETINSRDESDIPGCTKTWDLSTGPYRIEMPNPYGLPELETVVENGVYWDRTSRRLQGAPIYTLGGKRLQFSPSDNKHFQFYNNGILYSKYSGYSEFTSFEAVAPVGEPCGGKYHEPDWSPSACTGGGSATIATIYVDGKGIGRRPLIPQGYNNWGGSYVAIFDTSVLIGRQITGPGGGNNTIGGVNPGDKPVSTWPFNEALPLAAVDGRGGTRGLMTLEISISLEVSATQAFIYGTVQGGFSFGIEDHPDNPNNIEQIEIGDFGSTVYFEFVNHNCLSPGTLNFNVPAFGRQRTYASGWGPTVNFTIPVSIVLSPGITP